jgi:hypothetical protein
VLPRLPVRLGISLGGSEWTAVAVGFGIESGPARLDFSVQSRERAIPFTGKSIAFAFSIGFSG